MCVPLRRGHWSVQGELDLHRLTSVEARDALADFLFDARGRGLRCVRVIHGKGLSSPNREPVLKSKVRRWLSQMGRGAGLLRSAAPWRRWRRRRGPAQGCAQPDHPRRAPSGQPAMRQSRQLAPDLAIGTASISPTMTPSPSANSATTTPHGSISTLCP